MSSAREALRSVAESAPWAEMDPVCPETCFQHRAAHIARKWLREHPTLRERFSAWREAWREKMKSRKKRRRRKKA